MRYFFLAACLVVALSAPAYSDNVLELQILKNKAEQGDNQAAHQLGEIYYNGNGVPSSYLEAYYWLTLNGIGLNDGNRVYILRTKAYEHLTPEQKDTVNEMMQDTRARLAGHTLDHPSQEISNASRYCRKVVSQAARESDTNYKETYNARDEEIQKGCWLRVLAERGDEYAKSRLNTISEENKSITLDYMAAAQKLRKTVDQGDIAALISLRIATPQTDRDEYLHQFYKNKNITEASLADFPVKIFDNEDVPLPTTGVGAIFWLDNDTIIYKASDDKPLVDSSTAESAPTNEFIISVNLNSFAKKSASNAGLIAASQENYLQHARYGTPLQGCQILLENDGHACREKIVVDIATKSTYEDDFDPKVIIVKKDTGEEKKLIFDRPVYPLEFHFDRFSNSYWISSEKKVWRFDRAFNKLSEESYPKGIWGAFECRQSHWRYSWALPCNFLEFSVKHGFLISGRAVISDRDNSRKDLFSTEGLFLATKDGQAFKMPDDIDEVGRGISVSPDGCKAVFIKFYKPRPKMRSGDSMSGDELNRLREAKLGVVNVCQFFEKNKPLQ